MPRRCVCVNALRHSDLGMILAHPEHWQAFKEMLRLLDLRDRGLQNSMDKEWR
jgi:hypothetical protein